MQPHIIELLYFESKRMRRKKMNNFFFFFTKFETKIFCWTFKLNSIYLLGVTKRDTARNQFDCALDKEASADQNVEVADKKLIMFTKFIYSLS